MLTETGEESDKDMVRLQQDAKNLHAMLNLNFQAASALIQRAVALKNQLDKQNTDTREAHNVLKPRVVEESTSDATEKEATPLVDQSTPAEALAEISQLNERLVTRENWVKHLEGENEALRSNLSACHDVLAEVVEKHKSTHAQMTAEVEKWAESRAALAEALEEERRRVAMADQENVRLQAKVNEMMAVIVEAAEQEIKEAEQKEALRLEVETLKACLQLDQPEEAPSTSSEL
eukprot:TRINITY_DN26921_c0_g1_i1.p1 TRINITY_DN26921_c0_g1~~TRINITY_DN26921_c0_g1_i1.p1  ORF type:complete len:234 (-),score=54.82 TRINITY_DN26921_c0_g1_i1:32-733(-)